MGGVISLLIITLFIPIMLVVPLTQKITVIDPVPYEPHWADKSPLVPQFVLVTPPLSEYQYTLIPLKALAEIRNVGAFIEKNVPEVGDVIVTTGGVISLLIVTFLVPTIPVGTVSPEKN